MWASRSRFTANSTERRLECTVSPYFRVLSLKAVAELGEDRGSYVLGSESMAEMSQDCGLSGRTVFCP